jgi:hypothetical protein
MHNIYAVQTNFEACVGLRDTAVGMQETEQHWRCKNKVLTNIDDASWYIRNADLHRDLQMGMVTREIGKFAKKQEERLHHHVNVEAIQLLDNSELVWRLRRKQPFEVV